MSRTTSLQFAGQRFGLLVVVPTATWTDWVDLPITPASINFSFMLISALALIFCSTVHASPLPSGSRIVFFGDSITAGNFLGRGYVSFIRKELRRRFPERGIEVLNAGVSGDRVTELERRIERDVIAKNPTHVVIYIGINDVWHWENGAGTPLERYREGLENLVGRIQQAKAIPILCTPSVIGELKNRQNKFDVLLDQHATAVREVAAKYGLALCDLRKAFQEYLEQNNHDNHAYGVLTSDGVHLNHQGNELVARIIMEVFA